MERAITNFKMVDSINFVQKNFPKSIRATYIREQDVFEFIKKCHENDWAIIGVDGLEDEGTYLKPRLDMIADYSSAIGNRNEWNDFKISCNTLARNFFTKILKPSHSVNLVFDFTVYSEEDWSVSRHDFFSRLKDVKKKWGSSDLGDEELFEIVREGIYGGFSSKLKRMAIPQKRKELEKLFKELLDTLIE